eukprot:SAG11_NODE_37315_length_257_cov_0.981013_2_plen_23_part_01
MLKQLFKHHHGHFDFESLVVNNF